MAPPSKHPVTPSPRRFITKPQAKPGKRPSPAQGLTEEARSTPQQDIAPKVEPTSSQFAKTPRFKVPAARPAQISAQATSFQRPVSREAPVAPVAPLRQHDSIEEAPSTQDDDEMLDNDITQAVATTENTDHHVPTAQPFERTQPLPHPPKRRRIYDESTSTASDAKGSGGLGDQTAPRATLARFMIPDPTQVPSTQDSATNRPAFLRSSIPPPEPAEPLPDAFSPHRRGQRFVQGGMAAELQSWVLEAGQTAVASRRGKGYLRGEDWAVRIKADKVSGQKPVFIEGKIAGGGEGRAMLADGAAKGGGKNDVVNKGDVVGIRVPTWGVEAMGKQWIVGVDWKVIS